MWLGQPRETGAAWAARQERESSPIAWLGRVAANETLTSKGGSRAESRRLERATPTVISLEWSYFSLGPPPAGHYSQRSRLELSGLGGDAENCVPDVVALGAADCGGITYEQVNRPRHRLELFVVEDVWAWNVSRRRRALIPQQRQGVESRWCSDLRRTASCGIDCSAGPNPCA